MKKLDKLFKNSEIINIDNKSKIVIMSDVHRGIGNNYDNFLKNKNICKTALYYYYHKNFTYIELGDGDDMWEVKNYEEIINENIDVFLILRKFYNKNRFVMMYGNHDIIKRDKKILKKYFNKFYNKKLKQYEDLFIDLEVYESLILNYKDKNLFLLHGHQVDFMNSNLWKLSRFLIRHVWKNLEIIGTKDPTDSAKIYKVSYHVEKVLKKWSLNNNTIVIAGHTHRAIFPQNKESLYFNDGCLVHPNGITCIEIEDGKISLVKWELDLSGEKYISPKRIVLEDKKNIYDFFKD